MNNPLIEEDFIRIGFISGLSGVQGFLKVTIDSDFKDYFLDKVQFFYTLKDGMFVPYFIEGCKSNRDPILIKVESFDSRGEAVQLTDRDIYFRRDFIPDGLSSRLLLNPERWDINGFLMKESRGEGEIGKVLSMEEYPSGYMALVVDSESREFLVPLVEQFIVDIRESEQVIVMDLPEGIVPEE